MRHRAAIAWPGLGLKRPRFWACVAQVLAKFRLHQSGSEYRKQSTSRQASTASVSTAIHCAKGHNPNDTLPTSDVLPTNVAADKTCNNSRDACVRPRYPSSSSANDNFPRFAVLPLLPTTAPPALPPPAPALPPPLPVPPLPLVPLR